MYTTKEVVEFYYKYKEYCDNHEYAMGDHTYNPETNECPLTLLSFEQYMNETVIRGLCNEELIYGYVAINDYIPTDCNEDMHEYPNEGLSLFTDNQL